MDAFAIPEFVFDVPMLTDGGVDTITDEPAEEHPVKGLAD